MRAGLRCCRWGNQGQARMALGPACGARGHCLLQGQHAADPDDAGSSEQQHERQSLRNVTREQAGPMRKSGPRTRRCQRGGGRRSVLACRRGALAAFSDQRHAAGAPRLRKCAPS